EERSIGGLVDGALRGGVRRGCPVVLLLRGTGRVRARGARGGLIRSGPVRGGRPGAGRAGGSLAGGGRVCGGRSGPACGRRVGTGRGTCIGRRTASGLDRVDEVTLPQAAIALDLQARCDLLQLGQTERREASRTC